MLLSNLTCKETLNESESRISDFEAGNLSKGILEVTVHDSSWFPTH